MSEVKITLTEEAAKYVEKTMADMDIESFYDSDVYLRLYVVGGGCSGYKYGLAIEPEKIDTDTIFEDNGVKIVVDDVSIKYIDGAVIGYSEAPMGGAFTVTNPNTSGCGCGKSFKIEDSEENSGCESCCGGN